MPRYELPGQQGRKGNYRRRLRRPTVGVVPALLLFYCISQGAGNKITHFNPSRYVPVPPVSQDTLHVLQCRKYSAAGSYAEFSSASNPSRHFPYIPPHGARTSFANHSIHRQQRRRTVPRAFFLVLINTEECTAIVETDRDFADRNPPPHSSPKHPEPFAILIGDGPLRGYQRLRALRRRGTRKARKAVCRPSPRPIGRPRFYFAL